MPELPMETLTDADAVARRAAELLTEICHAREGKVSVCLAGGSTPKRLYQLLASEYRDALPWERMHWFWGDERFVPADHPDSNQGMVRAAMLDHVPVPPANIHPMAFDGYTPDQSAAAYEAVLRDYFGSSQIERGQILFDLMLLGVGEDGHTASLFPGSPSLDERRRWVLAVEGERPEPRITLTLPVLNASAKVLVLATGAGKGPVIRRISEGVDLPMARVQPAGQLLWLVDNEASIHCATGR